MNKIVTFLIGKRTYILSVILALYVLLKAFNIFVTTPEQDVTVYGLLAALFATTIRKAIK
jgi:hypothetical protein